MLQSPCQLGFASLQFSARCHYSESCSCRTLQWTGCCRWPVGLQCTHLTKKKEGKKAKKRPHSFISWFIVKIIPFIQKSNINIIHAQKTDNIITLTWITLSMHKKKIYMTFSRHSLIKLLFSLLILKGRFATTIFCALQNVATLLRHCFE